MEKTLQTTQATLAEDWREGITESRDSLKLKDGESSIVYFLDEGMKKSHPDFGNSVVFNVLKEGTDKPQSFFVKSNNFSLLAQIKALGKLEGQKVKISRTGAKRSDTRYSVTKV